MSTWLFWNGGSCETDEQISLEELQEALMQALLEDIERDNQIKGEKIC